jgi:hypothetical protein
MTAYDVTTKVKDFIDFVYADPEKSSLINLQYRGKYNNKEDRKSY